MARVSVWAAGPFLAACALLAWSGAIKLLRPASTRVAARAIGAPSSTIAVRALAATELTIAILGATFGHVGALLVAALYAGLAVVALRLLRRAPATPCGCLGASDAPVSRAHVALNVVAALVAVAAASGAPFAVLGAQPLAGIPFVVLALCTARLATITIDELPAVVRAAQEGSR